MGCSPSISGQWGLHWLGSPCTLALSLFLSFRQALWPLYPSPASFFEIRHIAFVGDESDWAMGNDAKTGSEYAFSSCTLYSQDCTSHKTWMFRFFLFCCSSVSVCRSVRRTKERGLLPIKVWRKKKAGKNGSGVVKSVRPHPRFPSFVKKGGRKEGPDLWSFFTPHPHTLQRLSLPLSLFLIRENNVMLMTCHWSTMPYERRVVRPLQRPGTGPKLFGCCST